MAKKTEETFDQFIQESRRKQCTSRMMRAVVYNRTVAPSQMDSFYTISMQQWDI